MKTILLFQREGLLLEGLVELFAKSDSFKVVRKSSDISCLQDIIKREPPDYILIGSSLLGRVSQCSEYLAEVSRAAKYAQGGSIHTVILVEKDDQALFNYYKSLGFSGLAFEKTPFYELEQTLKALSVGGVYVPSLVAEKDQKGRFRAVRDCQLTAREIQVLQGLSMGRSSKEISALLGISVNTVNVHRKRLLAKLRANSTADLVKYAIRMGLTPL